MMIIIFMGQVLTVADVISRWRKTKKKDKSMNFSKNPNTNPNPNKQGGEHNNGNGGGGHQRDNRRGQYTPAFNFGASRPSTWQSGGNARGIDVWDMKNKETTLVSDSLGLGGSWGGDRGGKMNSLNNWM